MNVVSVFNPAVFTTLVGKLHTVRINVFNTTIATFCILFIFWMPLFFYFSGISTISYLEESVGYRYFYSLRFAYGHEAAWLPQGHLVTLYHVLIQYLLTFFGLPNDQFFPRIDIFSLLALALPILLAWMACVKLAINFQNKMWSSFTMVFFLFMMQSPTLPGLPGGASWTLMPDYHVWVIPLAFFCALLLPNGGAQPVQKTACWFFGMGILTGLAGGLKLTFMLFPLSVLAIWIIRGWPSRDFFKSLVFSALACLLTLGLIFSAINGFSSKTLWQFMSQSVYFAKTQHATMKGADIPSGIESCFPLLLSTMLLWLGIKRVDWLLIIPGVAGIVYTIFVCLRFYNHSFIEYHAFTLMLLIPLIYVYGYKLIETTGFYQKIIGPILFCLVLVMMVYTSYHSWLLMRQVPHRFRVMNIAAKEFHQCLKDGPALVWILTTENTYRPHSIESSLCKGGMNIQVPVWGASPYIAELFPNFKCAVVDYGLTVKDKKNMASTNTIGFSHLTQESLHAAIVRVEKYFGLSLAASDCKDITGNYDAPRLTCCYPKQYVLMRG